MFDPLPVHPVADLFPMLAEDELQELADDIKQRGLLQPIVLDMKGRVLDGRNRLAACDIAGIVPNFETFDGEDPGGYALSVNIARRHLRAGARFLLTEKARRLAGITKLESEAPSPRLAEAAIVLDFAPDHVDNVLTGVESLQTAAAVARERKREAAERKAKTDRLRKAAPDLADQVDDGRLDLDEALGALEVREQRARQEAEAARREAEERATEEERERREREQQDSERRHRHTRSFAEALAAMWSLLDPDPAAFAEATWLPDANPHRTTPGAKDAFTSKGLRLTAERLTLLAEHVDRSGGAL